MGMEQEITEDSEQEEQGGEEAGGEEEAREELVFQRPKKRTLKWKLPMATSVVDQHW